MPATRWRTEGDSEQGGGNEVVRMRRLTLLAAGMLILEFCQVIDIFVDYDPEVGLGVVFRYVVLGEGLRHGGGLRFEKDVESMNGKGK